MKEKLLILLALLITCTSLSQIHDPVSWKTSVVKLSDTDYELISTATIEEGWHLYSQTVGDGGQCLLPLPIHSLINLNW